MNNFIHKLISQYLFQKCFPTSLCEYNIECPGEYPVLMWYSVFNE